MDTANALQLDLTALADYPHFYVPGYPSFLCVVLARRLNQMCNFSDSTGFLF